VKWIDWFCSPAYYYMPSLTLNPLPTTPVNNLPPKVVFIGDWITYNWTSAFAANPNWINQGLPADTFTGYGSVSEVGAQFQADVVSLHPAIVHILLGQGDADWTTPEGFANAVPEFEGHLEALVKEAQAANIKVVLGIEPPIFATAGQLELMNSVIASYGAANNIPVINYADALCNCISGRLLPNQPYTAASDIWGQYGGGGYVMQPATILPFPNYFPLVVSATGYALMTQMAETAIANITLTLKGGWLQNVEQYNDDEVGPGNPSQTGTQDATNVNTVEPGAIVQFTPVGSYSDGSHHLFVNTSFEGSNGTWTSSNPLVMYVNQAGLSWATSPGNAIIRYTSPSGVAFSEWVMTIGATQ
jgi:hypothetical protein